MEKDLVEMQNKKELLRTLKQEVAIVSAELSDKLSKVSECNDTLIQIGKEISDEKNTLVILKKSQEESKKRHDQYEDILNASIVRNKELTSENIALEEKRDKITNEIARLASEYIKDKENLKLIKESIKSLEDDYKGRKEALVADIKILTDDLRRTENESQIKEKELLEDEAALKKSILDLESQRTDIENDIKHKQEIFNASDANMQAYKDALEQKEHDLVIRELRLHKLYRDIGVGMRRDKKIIK